jgi:hypothetical protein
MYAERLHKLDVMSSCMYFHTEHTSSTPKFTATVRETATHFLLTDAPTPIHLISNSDITKIIKNLQPKRHLEVMQLTGVKKSPNHFLKYCGHTLLNCIAEWLL